MGLYLMAALTWNDTLSITWMILAVAVGLGLVIFVHELGHFVVAKLCGVKCEKFYLGFDIPLAIGPIRLPSRFCRVQWGETEYGIGILPLGGYVKMLGQDDNPANADKETDRIKIRKSVTGEPVPPGHITPVPRVSEDTTSPKPAEEPAPSSTDEAYELDPRSFPAKSVPQRMAIISAGVLMNLIFAVIFASFAFSSGVQYSPCEIGDAIPGSPAWRAGLQPGSRIIQLRESGTISEHLRFDWDLRNAVGLAGTTEDLSLLVRTREGNAVRVVLRPMVTVVGGEKLPMIGIEQVTDPQLAAKHPAEEGTPASRAQPPLQAGDRIVAINSEAIRDGYELLRALAGHVSETLRLTVQRDSTKRRAPGGSKEELEVTVQPNYVKDLGLVMTAGPISGVRPGSAAESAGFRTGDEIVSIQGEPLGDPLSLPNRIRRDYGRPIEVVVQRTASDGSRRSETLRVTPRLPDGLENVFTLGSPMAVKSLGIVFPVQPQVAGIQPGSPADQAGFQIGDTLMSVAFLSDRPDRKPSDMLNAGKPLSLDERAFTWPFLWDRMQGVEPDVRLSITYRRGGRTLTSAVKPAVTPEPYPDRGFVFRAKVETRRADSAQEAVVLGFRRTVEDVARVFEFLHKLFTGVVSPKNLGGPISIARVAGSEASLGLSRLLVFLTFLSANLAILNFLPIPALDGGHMLFLMAEGVRGKPVDERMQFALTIAGVACLLGLMIFVFALDIGRILL